MGSIAVRHGVAVPLRASATLAWVVVLGAGCSFDTGRLEKSGARESVLGPAAPRGSTTTLPSDGQPPSATGGPVGGSSGSSGGVIQGTLPCEVATVVANRCQNCHRTIPVGGAPNALMTLADFHREYTVITTKALVGQTVKVYELSRIRINGELGSPRMPEGSQLSEPDLATMNDWFTRGAPAGEGCSGPPPGSGVTSPDGGLPLGGAAGAGDPSVGPLAHAVVTPDTHDECENDPTQFEPLTPGPDETCYEFKAHGVSSPTDTTKFEVQPGESYNQFYYDVPWPPGTLATRFGARFDNLQVVHHWLGFSSQANIQNGTVQKNVLGTTIGESAELIGGWAVGGCNIVFPEAMGLKLPDSGRIMIQWHHYNSTGTVQEDATAVQWCTVPAGGRPNVGGLTFLGTEFFNGLVGMPPGKMSEFSGSCTNDSGKPITLVGFYPHMHLLGVNMKSEVTRVDGSKETVFDHPFVFDHQVNYMLSPGFVLEPGDKITSTCTFNNTTTANVAFGQSTTQEMCYQFTFAYPYDALNNGVFSLIGATNTCW